MVTNTELREKKSNVYTVFDDISPNYDRLNHILSGYMDLYWRRQLAKAIPKKMNMVYMDLATGTGDALVACLKGKERRYKEVYASDLSQNMMNIAKEKIKDYDFKTKIDFQTQDATALTYPDNFCDVITMAFGIRNVVEPEKTMAEMMRVLKPGGRALILEFSLPESFLFKKVYLWYLRNILPKIGEKLSGNPEAYRYLNQSVEAFPSGYDFCRLMKGVGFKSTFATQMTFGVVTLYEGLKV